MLRLPPESMDFDQLRTVDSANSLVSENTCSKNVSQILVSQACCSSHSYASIFHIFVHLKKELFAVSNKLNLCVWTKVLVDLEREVWGIRVWTKL